ncbi:hypothetical protein IWQ60_005984 [Tieghemiomyces parasiticus]|uniref:Uncharacterized protein n=1 Tax=Tieghemiomyces parasiticus TaxID=78921 RepID=A0A9W8A563_9FUNG|nr:hypothetical protein IWQ60_005984 [Tieghemiomyces parasiticus]
MQVIDCAERTFATEREAVKPGMKPSIVVASSMLQNVVAPLVIDQAQRILDDPTFRLTNNIGSWFQNENRRKTEIRQLLTRVHANCKLVHNIDQLDRTLRRSAFPLLFAVVEGTDAVGIQVLLAFWSSEFVNNAIKRAIQYAVWGTESVTGRFTPAVRLTIREQVGTLVLAALAHVGKVDAILGALARLPDDASHLHGSYLRAMAILIEAGVDLPALVSVSPDRRLCQYYIELVAGQEARLLRSQRPSYQNKFMWFDAYALTLLTYQSDTSRYLRSTDDSEAVNLPLPPPAYDAEDPAPHLL